MTYCIVRPISRDLFCFCFGQRASPSQVVVRLERRLVGQSCSTDHTTLFQPHDGGSIGLAQDYLSLALGAGIKPTDCTILPYIHRLRATAL